LTWAAGLNTNTVHPEDSHRYQYQQGSTWTDFTDVYSEAWIVASLVLTKLHTE